MSSSPLIYPVYAPQSPGRMQLWVRAWLPALAFSMVFAIESTSYFGADRTSAPLQRLAEALFGYDIGVYWETIHHTIRKTGHFLGYGVFSLVCFRGFWVALGEQTNRLRNKLRAHGLAVLVTFLVASADEIHQTFLPNRDGSFSDVMLDTCGAVALGLMLFLAMLAMARRRRARSGARRAAMPAYVE
jgi:VanZ family protein